jgi:hypothetical protein
MPRIYIKARLDNMGGFGRNQAHADFREVTIGPRLPHESEEFYRQVSRLASELLSLEPNFGGGRGLKAILTDQINNISRDELPREITDIQTDYLPTETHILQTTEFEASILIEPLNRRP